MWKGEESFVFKWNACQGKAVMYAHTLVFCWPSYAIGVQG